MSSPVPVQYGPAYDIPGTWEAGAAHPTQLRRITGNGSNETECKSNFVSLYNELLSTTMTLNDFDFIRSVRVMAEMSLTPDGYFITANPGDRPPVVATGATEEEAKELFVTTWNNQIGTNYELIEFQFDML